MKFPNGRTALAAIDVLIVAAVVILSFTGPPQDVAARPAAPSPLVSTRYRLCPSDPDRAWTLLTNFDGSLDLVWSSSLGSYQPVPLLGQVDLGYDVSYAGVLSLPASTPSGTYTFDVGRGPELTIQVVPPVRRKPVTVPSGGSSSDALKAALAKIPPAFAPDVTLAPGTHYWPDFVVLPANTVIHGDGATIRRTPGTNYGTNWPAFVIESQDVSIYGVTFLYGMDCPGGMVLGNMRTDIPTAGTGLVVSDCVFDGCNLGFFFFDSLVQRCEFKGGGAVIAPSGLFYRCTFRGPSVIDPFQAWTLKGARQMVCCDFWDTKRGVVHNAVWGPLNDCYYSTVHCHGIVGGDNANECWSCEGGPLNRLLAFHCRLSACESSAFQLDRGGVGGLIRDFQQDSGQGILMWSGPQCPTQSYVVQDSQIPCIYFGPGATDNAVKDSLLINFRPTRGDQTFSNISQFGYSRKIVAWAEGPNAGTNTLTNTPIVNLPAGYTPSAGVNYVQPATK